MTGFAVLLYLSSTKIAVSPLALQIALKILLWAAFPLGLAASGFFSRGEVEHGKTLAKRMLSRYRLVSVTGLGK